MLNEVFPRKMTKTRNYSFMCSLRYLLGLVTKFFQNGSKLGLIKHDLTDEKSHTSGATSNKIEGSIHSPSFSSSSSKTRFMFSLLNISHLYSTSKSSQGVHLHTEQVQLQTVTHVLQNSFFAFTASICRERHGSRSIGESHIAYRKWSRFTFSGKTSCVGEKRPKAGSVFCLGCSIVPRLF